MVITSDRFFYPILTHIMGFFFLVTTKYLILYWEKNIKRLPENPEYPEKRHICHFNIIMTSLINMCEGVELFFYFSHWLVWSV